MKHSADSPSTQESWIPVDSETGTHAGRRAQRGPAGARGVAEERGSDRQALIDLARSIPWGLVYGPVIVVILLIVGAFVGAALGRSAAVPEAVTSSPSPTPAFALEPPVQVGDLVRGEVTESSGPAPENQRIVRADYSDGANRLIFVMTWPEDDASAYVADAGVESVVQAGDGVLCGTSVDTSLPACGRVVDGTGLLLLAVTEQATADVAELLDEYTEAVAPGR